MRYMRILSICALAIQRRNAHGIVKRQAKINHLGFWDVSQSFDRTFPVTLPADRWPMLLEQYRYTDAITCQQTQIRAELEETEELKEAGEMEKTDGRSRVDRTDGRGKDLLSKEQTWFWLERFMEES